MMHENLKRILSKKGLKSFEIDTSPIIRKTITLGNSRLLLICTFEASSQTGSSFNLLVYMIRTFIIFLCHKNV